MLHFSSKAMGVACVLPYHQARTFTVVVLPAGPLFFLQFSVGSFNTETSYFLMFLHKFPASSSKSTFSLFLDD